ncbi:MAG: glycosyltransferase family 4 protein [Patescibacteria group bacterium]
MDNKKTKILYLVTQTDPGGAQKYVHDLTLNLNKENFEVEVGVGEGKEEKWMLDLKNQNIKVHRLKHVVRNLKPIHDFLSGFEIFSLLNKVKPDVIHLNSSKIGATGAVTGWIYKKLKNRQMKIIYTVHGLVLNEPLLHWQRIYYKTSEKISGWYEDKIICVSEFDKQSCLKNKIAKPKKLITIRNGVDLNNLNLLSKEEAKTKLGIINQSIGTIANLYETKGLIYLIRAAKILIDKHKDLLFIVIGQGKLKETLEKEIKKLNLENNFKLIGQKDNAQQYLPAFDIFCLPSVKEGLSYTLIEALVAGLPIITTDVGGNPEIVEDNVNGILVKPKKPLDLAEAIENILEDRGLQNKFKENNLEKAKQFSLDKMIKKTEEIYNL